jgi:radical SAM protein with 4Fe4S-binding SPASM domain
MTVSKSTIMNRKDLINEFIATYCKVCKSYVVCGGECMCVHFEKFMKSKTKNETKEKD